MSAVGAYHAFEMGRLAIAPARAAAILSSAAFAAATGAFGRNGFTERAAAAGNLFERMTRLYPKPSFGIDSVAVASGEADVTERTELDLPFCRLLAFDREGGNDDQALLLLAPMSGHHATLLRDTARRFIPSFRVFVTDWKCASQVPLSAGEFSLDDYVSYVVAMLERLGPGCHVMAVCQPAVPALMATALMEEDGNPCSPASLALLGGPIDTRVSPTEVNRLATDKGSAWFENLISEVPFTRPGWGRRVYPGFVQLSAFMSMNPGRHASAFGDYFLDEASGDAAATERHREFYDEYLSVMDLDARFYLDTIRRVFVEHCLPRGVMEWRGRRVDPAAIRRTALMTVEGGRDDITGKGQTSAAHGLCPNVPSGMRVHHVEEGAGHYGIFSGARFRDGVAPAYEAFVMAAARRRA